MIAHTVIAAHKIILSAAHNGLGSIDLTTAQNPPIIPQIINKVIIFIRK